MSICKDFGLIIDNPRRLLVAFVAINIIAFSGLVQSSIVYSQLPLDGAMAPASFHEEQSADDFLLTKNTLITRAEWWGTFTDAGLSDNIFDIRFFEDNGGVPGNLISEDLSLTATRKITGLTDSVSDDVFLFSASVSNVPLLAGIKYYVSIVHSSDALDDEFFWSLNDTVGDNFTRNISAPDDSWKLGVSVPGNLAFNLVPEPSAPVLFITAFLLFGFYRRSINV